MKPIRCDRWSKTGAFQMGGTGRWEQCKNNATKRVHIQPKYLGDWKQDQACCDSCYKEFVNGYYRPHKVLPLTRQYKGADKPHGKKAHHQTHRTRHRG